MTIPATAHRVWPLLIGVIILAFVIAMTISFRMAGRAGGGVVDRDYYEHGRQYESLALRERNADRAGWRLSCSRQGDGVMVTVTDGEGRGVTGALVRYLPTAVDASRAFLLEEKGGGVYLLPQAQSGSVQGRLTVSRGDCYLQGRLAVVRP